MSVSSSDVFRFLGRVKFTMILLLGGAVVMMVGTIIESRLGMEAAQSSIYRTAWFDAFLVLIVVNLVIAVVNRIPIQRHQWAFVLTHFSIVVLLIGAWISRTYGFEGRLAVREGETVGRLMTQAEEVLVRWGRADSDSKTVAAPAAVGRDGTVLVEAAADRPEVRAVELVPDGEFVVSLADGPDGSGPGIDFHVNGRGLHQHALLLADHRVLRRRDLGPVEIEIVAVRGKAFLDSRLKARDSGAAQVRIRLRGVSQPAVLTAPADVGQPRDIGGGLTATLVRFVRRARVEGGKLVESPAAAVNPAAVVEVAIGDRRETHTVFSQFPQFNIVAERTGAGLVESVALHASAVAGKPLATIIVDPSTDRLWMQLSAASGRGPGLLFKPGQTVAIGNLGIDLEVLDYKRRAEARIDVRRAAKPGEGRTYLRVAACEAGAEGTVWLPLGSPRTITLGSRKVELTLRPASVALPFTVELEDFEVRHHPGSMRPAEFRSSVVVTSDAGTQPVVISMNRPFDVAGYRLFQTSYVLGMKGERDTTILTASYDPGVPVVYVAFVLLIIGVAWYVFGSGRRARALAAAELARRPDRLEPAREQVLTSNTSPS